MGSAADNPDHLGMPKLFPMLSMRKSIDPWLSDWDNDLNLF